MKKEQIDCLTLPTTTKKRCSNYDNDCDTMTPTEALYCFTGLKNHPCNPGNDCGMADGECPIL